jgi:hypothetical protein
MFLYFQVANHFSNFPAPATQFNFLSRMSRHIYLTRHMREGITKKTKKYELYMLYGLLHADPCT